MRKRIISLLLVVCMVMTILPADIMAAEVKRLASSKAASTTASAAGDNPFTDVQAGSWYASAVDYVRANGFFNGTSATTFEPNGTMTRGMFVTVLGRMAGVDIAGYSGSSGFSDVKATAWYAPYVKWAAQHGITSGTSINTFSPDMIIDREQMAAFFARYFEIFGIELTTDNSVSTTPSDLADVSDWARSAVLRVWSAGLMNGDGTAFSPKSDATRAQTAVVCQRIDIAVKKWYKEPGVPSDRVSVDPAEQKPGDTKPSGDDSGDSGNSGNTGTTTNYEVKFAVGSGIASDDVTLPETKLYPEGTKISTIPTPYKQGGIFLGWYYDETMSRSVGESDTVTRNMTLYAKMADAQKVSESDTPNYVTVTVGAGEIGGYTFDIVGYYGGCISSFINVTANNAEFTETSNSSAQYRYTVNGETVSPVFEQGQTYSIRLDDASEACFRINGELQPQSVRILNIITEKAPVDRLELDSGVIMIDVRQVSGMTGKAFDGLFSASVSTQSGSGIEQNESQGTFKYSGSEKLSAGDTVAIYEGLRPDERQSADEGGAVVYLEITDVSGDTYSYKTANTEDVLFTPDVLPVSVNADTDGSDTNNSITVPAEVMDFSDDIYADMNLDATTTVDEGDFIAFYSGTFGSGAGSAGYARITGVTFINDEYIITYDTDVSEADIMAAMDVYNTREEEVELTAAEKKAIEDDMVRQAEDSGFVDEAAQYLAGLALQTDGFRQISGDLEMGISSYSATYSDGTPVAKGDIAVYAGSKAKITNKKVEAKVGTNLQHFDGSRGIRAELSVTFTVEVGDKIEIIVQAVFEQEVLISINTSGGAIWKWKWIFPYIADYQLNANIDLGTYTGVGITATAKTKGEEDSGYDWKSVTGSSAENKIIDIGKQITELMEAKEEFLGENVEWNGNGGGTLAQKYSKMMEDAEESWAELLRVNIFSKEGAVDKLHILAYGIGADFVVKVNLYVTVGLTFEYAVAKRYNFSIKLFSKQATSETVDLEEAHYQFDFYVMGTMGIRAGVEFEIAVGLFSVKLDSVGITAEAGAYAQMWGYFYYHLSWAKGQGKTTSSSGALFVEVGLYLTVTFKAQLFQSDKLTYQPTLYEGVWPLWNAGAQENVYDFAYDSDDPGLTRTIHSATQIPVWSRFFDMNYMDMKSGDLYGSDADDPEENPAKNYDDATESRYIITLSNPKFTYDPATNMITVDKSGQTTEEHCEMTITWKNAPLAFTSKPISRTMTIDWDDPDNTRYINFLPNGGNGGGLVTAIIGVAITAPEDPTRTGYTFGGWYTNKECTPGREFTVPETMGRMSEVVFAKWIPNTDTKYKAEHYLQELNGSYTLVETETLTGTTDSKTTAAPKSFTGFEFRQNGSDQQIVAADGSTVVKLYYTRKTYEITFAFGPEGAGSTPLVYKAKYGSVVYAPKLALGGYDFVRFTGYNAETPDGGVIVRGNAAYTAEWTERDDTPYRVEHYVQRLSGSGYMLPNGDGSIESRYGTTGATIDTSSLGKELPGMRFVRATVNGTAADSFDISADGKTVVKLYYDRIEYTLSFDTMGAAETFPEISKMFEAEVTVSELPVPERQGYAFTGWYTDKACGEESRFTAGMTMPAKDLTLFAGWSAGEYSITYTGMDNAAFGESHPDKHIYGTETVVSDPTRTGYVFEGWRVNGKGDPVRDLTLAADGYMADITLEAIWSAESYDISYELDGGVNASANPEKHTYGKVTRITDPTRDGYTFGGWIVNGSGDPVKSLTLSADGYTSAITLTATWSVNRYTITFDTNGGSAIDPITQDYGSVITKPADPTRDGYTFAGWTREIPDTMPAGDITITAKWTANRYTISFDTDGGSYVGDITQDYESAITKPADPTKTGYVFDGWQPVLPGKMPLGGLRVKALWRASTNTAYVVEHYRQNADDDDYTKYETSRLSGTTGEPVTASAKTYDHFTLNTGVDGTKQSGVIAADGSLVLKLYYDRETVKVTLDPNGGDLTSDKEVTFKYGQTFLVTAPTKAGYAFDGWYDGDSRFTGAVTSDMTLTAHWTIDNVNFTVRHYVMDTTGNYVLKRTETLSGQPGVGYALGEFVDDSYQEVCDMDVYYGVAIDLDKTQINGAPAGEYDGYNDGKFTMTAGLAIDYYYKRMQYKVWWYNTADHSQDYEETLYYGAELTLPNFTAEGFTLSGWKDLPDDRKVPTWSLYISTIWTANKYDIIYDLDGGVNSSDNPTQYTYDEKSVIYAPTRVGYAFTGWRVNGSDIVYPDLTLAAFKYTDAIRLTATWEKETYKITFANEWGMSSELPETISASYNEIVSLPAPGAQRGYTFSYWKDASGNTYTDKITMPDKNISLTAIWTVNKHKITYVTDRGTVPPESIEVEFGKLYQIDFLPSAEGYYFSSWTITSTDSQWETITTGQNGEFNMPDGDVTLTANWTAYEYRITYNEMYDVTNSDDMPSKHTYGTDTNVPNAKKEGYTFGGWIVNGSGDPVVDLVLKATDHTSAITLKPTWSINSYTITFNSNGGEAVDPLVFEYHDQINLPTPKREGYTFEGWYKDGSSEQYTQYWMPAENFTLTAKWTPYTYNINYSVYPSNLTIGENEITSFTTADVEKGRLILPVLTRDDGYDFLGWSLKSYTINETDRVCYTEINSDNFADFLAKVNVTGVTRTITLYTNWEKAVTKIYSEADLAAIRDGMNADGQNYKDVTFRLMNDIVLGESWETIGVVFHGYEFDGTIHGNGYTITLNNGNPLFSNLGSSATVKNLYITFGKQVEYVNTDTSTPGWGALAIGNKGKIENCHVYGRNIADEPDIVLTNASYAGGLLGETSGSVSGCTVGVDKNGNAKPLYIEANECWAVGGLAGTAAPNGELTISQPDNAEYAVNVRIKALDADDVNDGVGGVVGRVSYKINFEEGTKVKTVIYADSSVQNVGGLVGKSWNGTGTVTTINDEVKGADSDYVLVTVECEITGEATNVGGVLGLYDGELRYVWAIGSVEGASNVGAAIGAIYDGEKAYQITPVNVFADDVDVTVNTVPNASENILDPSVSDALVIVPSADEEVEAGTTEQPDQNENAGPGGDGEEEEKPEETETPALPPEEGTIESKPEDGDTPDTPSGDGDPEEPEE